jgi:UPF0755 protein
MAQIISKLKKEQSLFWSQNNRIQKAELKGMSQDQIYTLASIVEEETNYDSDKSLIASVYQNRLKKQRPLRRSTPQNMFTAAMKNWLTTLR